MPLQMKYSVNQYKHWIPPIVASTVYHEYLKPDSYVPAAGKHLVNLYWLIFFIWLFILQQAVLVE